MRISCDPDNLKVGISLGNHLLNFFYCCNLAYRHNYTLCLPMLSDIEKVGEPQVSYRTPPMHIYAEPYYWANIPHPNEFSLHNLSVASKSGERQLIWSLRLLENGISQPSTIKGYFRHSELFNQEAIENFIKFEQGSTTFGEKDLVLHVRGTDFIGYGRPVFKNLVLGESYYVNAIGAARERLGDVNLKVITDHPSFASNILKDYDYELLDLDVGPAWLALKECTNLVMTCSTFCWTAALFPKQLLIQPKGGLNFENPEVGTIPYGFDIPGAIKVNGQTEN